MAVDPTNLASPEPLKTRSQRLPGFDGVRGIAIVLVMLWHGTLMTSFPPQALGPARLFVMTGWVGVDLFFALSGFLITRLLLREEEHSPGLRFSLKRFYWRRALRILPIFFVVFLLDSYVLSLAPGVFTSVEAGTLRAHDSPFGLFPYATFWGNYFLAYFQSAFDRPVLSPGLSYIVFWSLCVEEHFYLLWPLFLLAVKGWRKRLAVALSVCAAACLLRAYASACHLDPHPSVHTVSHYRMDSILWGAIGALLQQRGFLMPNSRPRRLALLGALGCVALLVQTGSLSQFPPGTALGESLGLSMLAVSALLVLAELVARPSGHLARLLDWRPLRLLGTLSYAMYLVHFAAIDVGRALFFATPRVPSFPNFLLANVLFVTIAAVSAGLLHVAVERPFLKLKERFRC